MIYLARLPHADRTMINRLKIIKVGASNGFDGIKFASSLDPMRGNLRVTGKQPLASFKKLALIEVAQAVKSLAPNRQIFLKFITFIAFIENLYVQYLQDYLVFG